MLPERSFVLRRALSGSDAKIRRVAPRVLPVGLVLTAAVVGASGHARLGFYVLVAAVPAAAAAALALYGDLLDAPAGAPDLAALRLELGLAVCGLVLLVAAAAIRSPGVDPTPAASATALGACVAVLIAQTLVAFAPQPPELLPPDKRRRQAGSGRRGK